ncbi:gephyrin-like molybdotransferase Glp [Pseudorhodoferax sp. Leaf274]|uniref:molybdopterin molybdotransferase MoeA n=1 Tax=Pseudorhodoferax sp. Leaf274 TaxID=1736318 RepID=UPI000703C093|nr:gephyrin-like molybdotransferase Glp [Pseudorhodoferax sp. Leaf274]KQP43062.1 molybdenum cofactor biosynthesis protein MoaA [Pseudorhodoferax sp. Leaf274]
MTDPAAKLKTLDEALAQLMGYAVPLAASESVSTFDADRRVLARDVVSGLQVPPLDNSAMDGYALRCADVPSAGTVLPVSQRIPAGSTGTALAAGTAARIFTGAPVPEGADAVVMQEDCEPLDDGRIRVRAVPTPGQSIRRAGEDVALGTTVLARGTRLTPAALGMAASIGLAQLTVTRRPRVALFSTGDELVMPGEVPPAQMRPGAIYNSNRFFLRALLQRLGCEVSDLGIVPDRQDATVQALRTAAQHHDLVLTSGGVSVGEEDHVKPAVQALGRLELWQIAIKPGKPFAYGAIARDADAGADADGTACHFIGLPGNPVSSLVTFVLLVRPFLLQLQGATRIAPAVVHLPAAFEWKRADRRREFLRARRNADGALELFPNQSSGVLTSVAACDGLVDTPAGQPIAHGDTVRFLPFEDLWG